MIKTGLFFGSYNPIHIGHLAIANYIVEFTDLDELWFVVSPQNPLKAQSSLLADYHRLEMVEKAIGDDLRFKASNIEFGMPKPSYTIDTLTYLQEKHRDREFFLIMGSDNIQSFHKWKNYQQILDNFKILVYPRPNCHEYDLKNHPSVTEVNAPNIEISSTFIRQSIKENKDIRYFLPASTYEYIDKMNFYKK